MVKRLDLKSGDTEGSTPSTPTIGYKPYHPRNTKGTINGYAIRHNRRYP